MTAGSVAAGLPGGAPQNYWSADAGVLVQRLGSTPDGLSATAAAARLREYGPNAVREQQRLTRTGVLLNQLRNPLLLILVFAALASAITGEWVDALIVMVIVLSTVSIGYAREYHA
jgi:P-type Mg2+ transporter